MFAIGNSTHTDYSALTGPAYYPRVATVSSGSTYPYQMFIPAGYNFSNPFPVILSFHGSGERGSNNTAQLYVGLGPWVSASSATFNCVVVLPQLPNFSDTTTAKLLEMSIYTACLASAQSECKIDPEKVYLTGISNGAFLAWGVAGAEPNRYAALAPISGGINPAVQSPLSSVTTAQAYQIAQSALSKMPIHTYHGDADSTVTVTNDRDINTVFGGPTSTFLYTELAGSDHGPTWTSTYSSSAFWSWFTGQRKR